ncbi:MAG: M15 family metallopeptidase [Pseudomonas balearica]|uniref:M15 family metallopeptidase n=1 Tax=Stutzerimonas balearica TaxID=74829 RepID=UPI001983BEE1|nr:M15 family metallopeptidase [Stutzerimonas balearica]MBC7198146.1 M15 family metallopeptidase [Stutzerimonas balearica]
MFNLSSRSEQRLSEVHPDLQKVVRLAIRRSKIDFTVLEGLRSATRQKQLVAQGKSKTLDGRHITGHAVDLGAYVGGQVSWNWEHYYTIAEAMRDAAVELGVPIVWGGVWDKRLNLLHDTKKAVADYVQSRKVVGRDAFIDGPHFELDRKEYPA